MTGLLDMGECLSLDGENLPSVQAPPISNDGIFLFVLEFDKLKLLALPAQYTSDQGKAY